MTSGGVRHEIGTHFSSGCFGGLPIRGGLEIPSLFSIARRNAAVSIGVTRRARLSSLSVSSGRPTVPVAGFLVFRIEFPFLLGGLARSNDPNHIAFSLSENYENDAGIIGGAKQLFANFSSGVSRVIEKERIRVIKGLDRLVERNAMFRRVLSRLLWVPIKLHGLVIVYTEIRRCQGTRAPSSWTLEGSFPQLRLRGAVLTEGSSTIFLVGVKRSSRVDSPQGEFAGMGCPTRGVPTFGVLSPESLVRSPKGTAHPTKSPGT